MFSSTARHGDAHPLANDLLLLQLVLTCTAPARDCSHGAPILLITLSTRMKAVLGACTRAVSAAMGAAVLLACAEGGRGGRSSPARRCGPCRPTLSCYPKREQTFRRRFEGWVESGGARACWVVESTRKARADMQLYTSSWNGRVGDQVERNSGEGAKRDGRWSDDGKGADGRGESEV